MAVQRLKDWNMEGNPMSGRMPFDPMGDVSPQDQQYLEEQRRAKARQDAAWEGKQVPMSPEDEERKRLSDEFRRKTMASHGMTPAEIAKKFQENPPPPPETADDAAPAMSSTGGVPLMFVVLTAKPEVAENDIPQAKEQFAPDWKSLKERIQGYDGTWIVETYEFHPHVALVLGFFGKQGWNAPEDALKESFEVIVKDSRVFRTDPE